MVKAIIRCNRIFTGIDSLNSAALAWLDIEANGTYNYDTKRIPREAFMEEAAILVKFYQSIMLLNETRSIIFITNRELSSWVDAAEDKHLMQTLIDRITVNSQIIRLN